MTYIKKKVTHRCDTPWFWESGDIWECDECGQQWKSKWYPNPDYCRWVKVWFRRKKANV